MKLAAVSSLGLVFLVGCATASNDVGDEIDVGVKHDVGNGDAARGDTFDPNGGGPISDANDKDSFADDAADTTPSGGDTAIVDTGSIVDSGHDTAVHDSAVPDSSVPDSGAPDSGVDTGALVDTAPPPKDTAVGCTTLEDFEGGGFSASWGDVPGSGGGVDTYPSSSAHDGSFGWAAVSQNDWHYRLSPSIGNVGDRITAWVRGASGRAYLGFSATASGAKSFVFAPNTGEIRFQDNSGWAFTELAGSPASFVAAHWYKMEVVFGGGGNVTGNVYDSDGTTRLYTFSHAYGSVPVGGVALRAFATSGSTDIDTIQFCPGP